ncbi:hypothetical protein [Frigoriflavimonas asaccharolytica]|uniref:DUF2892 family protein n=1 Tax=Frigoriflavimonas asaccharolytica TaxID=2735899 RepID=A0A8J8G8F5_9FLAO|nr:hypothetical protein [Frigoriflavimonas asaccharolytica]NRS93343.1 hypothetical protein [Frigoriflavimonas asaccharolytica]
MKNIVTNWNIKRFIYLLVGIFFIVSSIIDQFWIVTIIGIYAVSMAVFGFGCAAGNCTLEPKKNKIED